MQRIMTSTVLVFAGALLLSGCSAGGGTATPSADPCETLQTAVRDISNGVQNALAGADPAELEATLEGYSERVDALDVLAEGDSAVSDIVDSLDAALAKATEFAATLPTDAEDIDSEALAEQQEAIQDAASRVKEACAE
jgi:hypothetical protein